MMDIEEHFAESIPSPKGDHNWKILFLNGLNYGKQVIADHTARRF